MRNQASHRALALAASLTAAALAGCHSHDRPPPAPSRSASAPATTQSAEALFPPIASPALPNARRVTDKVICGGLPDGDRGFADLQALGVKTVIDVDGITPQVDLAHAHGMRYVHLPFGYDGVPADQGEAIAKAITELPGPIYIHCHHGQHRSPAAAAVACVENGTLPPDEAEAVLKTFGTGANYVGLWASARAARPVDPVALAKLDVHYVETAPVPPMAKAMVNVDDAFDALKAAQKAGWPGGASAEASPAHHALMLEELLKEVGRSNTAASKAEEFQELLQAAVSKTHNMGAALAIQPFDAATANASFAEVTASCAACHRKYRDVR